MIIKQKYWHALFEASVFIKAINGAWETISGFTLLFISRVTIAHAFFGITKNELSEDPHDRVLGAVNHSIQNLSAGNKDFVALYILSHGLINIFLAYYLYKEKLWAFWVSITFFSGSVLYLIFRASQSHSPMLYVLIVFDTFFIYLTIHEFKYRREQVRLNTQEVQPI
ncbi:MAG TPA: DUF2127 domain-containing protein [Patescibacteria group bacterium]|jgi:uncharacterized membrane protein|nr:DUF2127 domain-containing protein [Patescibacteria group bacterium]